jgi:hypothetical protein
MQGSARIVLKVAAVTAAFTAAASGQGVNARMLQRYSTPPPPPAPAEPAPAPAGEFTSADQLLTALESADRDLTSLTADVMWDRTFEIQGDRQARLGHLFYVVNPSGSPGGTPERKFAIHFDHLNVGGVDRAEDRWYIFDGRWVMERDAVQKFYQKREVVPPGETFNPLAVGGPFPIPIGQKKADITARYDVEILPTASGLDVAPDASDDDKNQAEAAKTAVQGCWQLKLVPKPQFTEEEPYTQVRLWYKRSKTGDILPRMARTVSTSGDVSTVLLIHTEPQYAGRPDNPKAHVPPDAIDTTPPAAGWEGTITPWRGHELGGPGH